MRIANYFLALFVFLVIHTVKSQDINDLKSINVDQLTDAQVQQFLDKAKESGMTLDQLEVAAQTRGMPASQISKLRNRIRTLQLKSTSASSQIESSQDRLREDNDATNSNLFETLSSKDTPTKSRGLKIYGSDIFTSSTSSFVPSQNIATPNNYVLGAGDELIIDVFGASEITYQQVISPDGKILISGVGPIPLSGISIQAAKNRIINRLSTIYSGIRGSNPNTFVQVSLGQVRSIKVNVVGNVSQPGTYTLTSFSTIFNALYSAGGPSESGSMRSIDLIRNGQVVTNLDVYEYLFKGDDSKNIQLQDGDIILVRPYLNRVKLAGEIKNPAIYELNGKKSLSDLITLAGGFSENAYTKKITIDRVGEFEKEVLTVNDSLFNSELVQAGDSIFITKVLDTYRNRVKIQGAVRRAGYFELTNELTLSQLIVQAGGLRPDAYLKRGNIIRLASDLSLQNISFDVKHAIDGEQDFVLSSDDLVLISSIFDIEEKKTVTINGQVRSPGVLPFVNNMTVEDVIGLSGGLQEDASVFTIEVARRLGSDEDLSKSSEIITLSINKDLSVSNASQFKLRPFDLILIKSTPYVREHKVIEIEGEVNFPGLYALRTHEDKISDLIKRAGGLTEFGFPEGAILIRKTEYFQTRSEKRAINALLDKRRKDLESKYSGNEGSFQFIEKQLSEYEKELTENLKRNNSSDELEARIFRTRQLRRLLARDSIGGFSDVLEQESIGIELEKALNNPGSIDDLIVRDGDLISIPKKLETVRIQGEVLYPNTLRFEQGSTLKKYVSAAGGFSSRAKVGKSYVVYANGSAKRTRNFLFFRKFPRLKPGADIIIPQKPERKKMSVQEVLGITSSLATIALIIDRLSQ